MLYYYSLSCSWNYNRSYICKDLVWLLTCEMRLLDSDMQSSLNTRKAIFDKGRLSHTATAYAPSSSMLTKCQESSGSARESPEIAGSVKDSNQPVNARVRPGSSTSSTSEGVGAASVSSAPGLSPSSSMGSLSSEKSSLNPYAKVKLIFGILIRHRALVSKTTDSTLGLWECISEENYSGGRFPDGLIMGCALFP